MELLNNPGTFIILLRILKATADNSKSFCKGTNYPTTFFSCYNFKNFPTEHDFVGKVKGFSMDGDNNKLVELKTNDLYQANVPDLEILYLQHSQIENIELGAFNFGFNLQKLDLSSNKLQNIDLNVFKDLSRLNELNLEDNPIKDSLKGQSFPNLNLTKLSLSECQLSSIEPNLFKNLNNLRSLNLDLNDLTTLTPSIFFSMKNLEELSLILNKLNFLDPTVFSGLSNLQTLFLSGNPVQKFKENQFLNINLTTLHLEDCEITNVHPNLFKNLKNLQSLYLNNNKLTSIDGKVFTALTSLKEAFLENNPWHCDCQIELLLETFNKMGIEINKEYGYPTCTTSSSSDFVGKDWFLIKKNQFKCTPEVNMTTSNKESNQSIAFYKRPYRQKEIFQAKLENQCQILPPSTREKIESVKTDSCVILFPTETCESREGYSLKVEQYQGQVLLSFSNVSQSFQSCEGYEAQHKKDEVKLTEPNGVTQIEKASTNCKNIQRKAYNSTLDVESEQCVTLYNKINCSGTNFTLIPHSGVKLDKNFNRMVQSFNSCTEFRKKKQLPPIGNLFALNYLQIFENLNYTRRILEAPIKETCTTLRENMWSKTKSAKTESCVILFSEQYCLGFQARLYPGQELNNKFQDKLVSFMACGDENEDLEAGFIEFYDNPHFDYVLHKTKLNGTCQQLPLRARNRAESVKTGSCVILFASDSCANYSKNPQLAGFSLQVFPKEGNILPLFENAAQSFQSCESFKSQEKSEPKVTFYGGSEEIELTEEYFLTKKCKNLNNLGKNVTGVETNHCLQLYSEMECVGKNFTLRPNSGVRLDKYFNRMAASFNSCSEFVQRKKLLTEDLSTLPILQLFEYSNKTGMILSSPIKETCTTPKESSWNKAASIKTESCVQLYSLAWCQGFTTVLYPREELNSGFINKTVSFMACENQIEDAFTSFEQQEIETEEEEEAKAVVNYLDKLAEGFGRFIESTFS